MQTNIQNIENLLSQTATITNSYKRVEKATGENFNIFSVLGIEHYEESTHSRFIAELLNSNGRHGFDNLFLIKFLDLLGIDNTFFDVSNYKVETEVFIGNVTNINGGRIDILLTDNNNGSQVMIENKIYATEQPNQLLRYYNYNPNGKLLYLTLFGSESEQKFDESKYTTISYSDFIINWLEDCQKIAVENPIVRETIRQYKNLVKKLTNQNINKEMNKEILNTIVNEGKKENFESFIALVNLQNQIYKEAVENHLYPTMDRLIQEFDLKEIGNRDEFLNKSAKWLGFGFTNQDLEKYNLEIFFSSNVENGIKYFVFGFTYINQSIISQFNYDLIQKDFFDHFGGKQTNNWLAQKDYKDYFHWDDLNTLKEIIHGDFKNDFRNKVKTMLEIIKRNA